MDVFADIRKATEASARAMTWATFHFLRQHHTLISPWVYNPFVTPPRLAAEVILRQVMPEHRRPYLGGG